LLADFIPADLIKSSDAESHLDYVMINSTNSCRISSLSFRLREYGLILLRKSDILKPYLREMGLENHKGGTPILLETFSVIPQHPIKTSSMTPDDFGGYNGFVSCFIVFMIPHHERAWFFIKSNPLSVI
jgi:hypothetical protein